MIAADIQRTLLFLLKEEAILLAMKKRGFGAGRWNGAGGKLEAGETLEQALIRETQEEIGVTPLSYHKVAELDFISNAEIAPWHMFVHAFICREWQSDPVETEEMAPKWFDINDIPYDTMWQDDQYWLPLVLAGDKITATFEFDDKERLLSHQIQIVKKF